MNRKSLSMAFSSAAALLAFGVALATYWYKKNHDQKLAAEQIKTNEAAERLKRFEKFQDLQIRSRSDKSILAVQHWLYLKPKPPPPSEFDMFTFMSFFEEVAIMVNSELMTFDLACYTIGVDAAVFYNDPLSSPYHKDDSWTLFNSFAQEVDKRFKEMSKSKEETTKLRF